MILQWKWLGTKAVAVIIATALTAVGSTESLLGESTQELTMMTDPGGPPPDSTSDPAASDPGPETGVTPMSCDDGDPCNGIETFDPVTSTCVPGTPVVCDSTDLCSPEYCDPSTGLCVPMTPISCDDYRACSHDHCDPLLGCQHDEQDCKCKITIEDGSINSQIYSRGNNDPQELYGNFVRTCRLADGNPAEGEWMYESGRYTVSYAINTEMCDCWDEDCMGMTELKVTVFMDKDHLCADLGNNGNPEDWSYSLSCGTPQADDPLGNGECTDCVDLNPFPAPGAGTPLEENDDGDFEATVKCTIPCDEGTHKVRVVMSSELLDGPTIDPLGGPEDESDWSYAVTVIDVTVEMTKPANTICELKAKVASASVAEPAIVKEGFTAPGDPSDLCCPAWDADTAFSSLPGLCYIYGADCHPSGMNSVKLIEENGTHVADPYPPGPPNGGSSIPDDPADICDTDWWQPN